MNYIKEIPFKNLNILEYYNIEEYNFLKSSNIVVNTRTKNMELISSYSYEILSSYANIIAIRIEPENNLNYLEVKAIVGDTKISFEDDEVPKEDEPKKSNILIIIVVICAVIFLVIIVIICIIRRKSNSNTLSLIKAINGGPIYDSTPLIENQPQQQ